MNALTVPPVQDLLDAGPDAARAFLSANGAAPNVSWHSLAQGAASKARIDTDLRWALIAIEAYRRWAESGGDGAEESARQSIMMLHAFFIRACGPKEGDPVCDPRLLIAAFQDNLPYSFSEASLLSKDWPSREMETLRHLRHIKNRLNAFKVLEPALLDQFPTVGQWLALREKLP